MVRKVFVVTDLGPGDGGKGGVVHAVAKKMRAHTVVKVGGTQGSHGVCTFAGESFAFSQWGCGTFDGARTHLSSRFVASPEGLLNEGTTLKYVHGVHDAFDLLSVDERALCTTPYYRFASRLKELARGNNPRGTVGTGAGETCRYLHRFPELAIRARDLFRPDLKERLSAVRAQVRSDLDTIIHGEFLPDDRDYATKEIELLEDDDFLALVARRYREASLRIKTVGSGFLGREILSKDGVVVVESSHGVLTDCVNGFCPHTSALRTLPCFTHAMLKDAGYNGQIVNLGVTRAYAIRHGAGPMPTDDPTMYESLLPGSHKDCNRYQGKARVGPLDLVLLKYAIEACGGPKAFDGLAVTWFDQVQTNGVWHLCNRYCNANDQNFFTPSGAIKVVAGEDDEKLKHQEALGKQLMSCIPELTTQNVSLVEREKLYSLCANILQEGLGVPVRVVSFGSTERDKVYG